MLVTSIVSRLIVFGRDDCTDTQRSKAFLDALALSYEYRPVDADPDSASRAQTLSGGSRVPVIVLPSGVVLVEPSDEQLAEALAASGS